MSHQTNVFLRVTPMAAPVMHQVDLRVHHFYVANRNIWNAETDQDGSNWEDFITGGEDGMNTDTVPTIATDGIAGGLLDHLGIPPVAGKQINALPIRAFNFIYNEWYRDQDLVTPRGQHDLTIPRCSWEKDYFSVARPWSQKGPQVSIPVGDRADVHHNAPTPQGISIYNDQTGEYNAMDTSGGSVLLASNLASPQSNTMYADLANALGADPIDVRRAWGLQRFMENAAMYGSRYPEKMRQLGSLYRGLMERPEFLGGGSQGISFSEVLQTANDEGDRDFGVGDLYGHGIAAARTNRYKRRIDEHGYVVTVMSCRPKALYQDGVHREYLRQDREDFHDPYLEDIGAQPVYNGELDFDHSAGEREVFGYSDRYQEYRQHPSCVSGEFRTTLDYWHLGRKLTDPVLNQSFVDCVPSKRIFNEQTQNSLWIMAHNKISAFRNISKVMRARTY